MSTYRDRVGQRVGSLEVLSDHKRNRQGSVIWQVLDHATGRVRYLRTTDLIRLDRWRLAREANQ